MLIGRGRGDAEGAFWVQSLRNSGHGNAARVGHCLVHEETLRHGCIRNVDSADAESIIIPHQ